MNLDKNKMDETVRKIVDSLPNDSELIMFVTFKKDFSGDMSDPKIQEEFKDYFTEAFIEFKKQGVKGMPLIIPVKKTNALVLLTIINKEQLGALNMCDEIVKFTFVKTVLINIKKTISLISKGRKNEKRKYS